MWRDRLEQIIDFEVRARRIVWPEPHVPAVHELPFLSPNHRFRSSVEGSTAP
jgi:hypothetical protein